jgi:YbbR domain-containing protein
MLRQNLGYKILAILLAVFLWFWVTITQRTAVETQSVTVAVELRNVTKRVAAVVDPQRIRFILRGGHDALESPVPAPQAYIDLRHSRIGTHTVKPLAVVPAGTRLIRMEPSHVELAVAPIISKTMKVEANIIGTMPPGYVMAQLVISPASVTISGVRQAVAQVSHVVVNVDASTARPDTPQTNILRAVDSSGEDVKGVTLSRSQARVTFPVQSVLSYKTVPVVVRTTGDPASGYRITGASVQPAVVTIAGDADRLGHVDSVRTVLVDITGATADVDRTVGLALPEGVTTVSEAREQVTVHIEPVAAPGDTTDATDTATG